MYKSHCDTILPGDNVIVGLGDSFTQGMGTYPLETWASIEKHNPTVYNIAGQHFVEEQGKGNWVRQLVDNHLPNYKVWNCGMNGGGNRSTIHEFFMHPLPEGVNNVIVILMCTAIERYDFLKKDNETTGMNWHQKWQTIFPCISDRGDIGRMDKEYFMQIWRPRTDAFEFLFNVHNIQHYCQAKGYKFLFASAFDNRISREGIKSYLEDRPEFVDMINWDNQIKTDPYWSVLDMVNQLENPPWNLQEIFDYCRQLTMPTKYLAPCGHWNYNGATFVADFIHKELLKREYV
jgi:hypothetical protein